MLPDSWVPLKAHAKQSEALRHPARFKALACGRGSGKTEIAKRRIIMALAEHKPWPDPIYFYALPTYKQAKRVAWKSLKALVPPQWIKKTPNESELYIETVFGSTLWLVGMDKPARIEGVQWDGCVIDESSDQKPGAFALTVMPALTHRRGWAWRIGVPKRFGIGAGEFKDFYDKGLQRMDDTFASWTWPSSDILSEDELAMQREALDERDFNEQYEASWEKASGAIFYAFSGENVTSNTEYLGNRHKIVVGSDFNVDPMSWVLCHELEGNLHVFDELFIRNTNTEETLNVLYQKYGHHQGGWEFYGDASAGARKTSAAKTDYIQIKNDERFMPKRVLYPKSNPPIANRFSACNALLRNKAGIRRCFINPRCKNLIKDLNSRAYAPGSREPNDSGDIGHISDALGYIIYAKWPVRLITTAQPKVIAR